MKVAIIGAGTIGLYIARKLSKAGHKVTVFEKNPTVGNKVCSGLFSERILDFVPESKKLIQNQINSVLINFPKKKIQVFFSKRFLVMDHSELDKLLGELCRQSGVNIMLSSGISEIPPGFDRVIGCDGFDSFTRKHLKMKTPSTRLGVQGFVKSDSKADFVETWPCKNGFLWKIPRGSQMEYGVMTDTSNAHKAFVDFVTKNSLSVANVRAKLIPQGLSIPANGQITLCGDSAGLTKPWSGGGVIWGLKAADILIDSFPNFSSYSRKAKLFFYPKIILSKIAVFLIYFIGFNMPWALPARARIESDFLL